MNLPGTGLIFIAGLLFWALARTPFGEASYSISMRQPAANLPGAGASCVVRCWAVSQAAWRVSGWSMLRLRLRGGQAPGQRQLYNESRAAFRPVGGSDRAFVRLDDLA